MGPIDTSSNTIRYGEKVHRLAKRVITGQKISYGLTSTETKCGNYHPMAGLLAPAIWTSDAGTS